MSEVKHTKCSGCKCWREDALFLNRKGRRLKTCSKCRDRFPCDKCDYKFQYKSDLEGHIKMVHDKIKDFECDKCDYKCSKNENLQQHINRVHYKIKDFECDKCDYKCSNNGHLNAHIKMVHDKIKDFVCDKCKYKFSTNSDLQRHIKVVHDKIKDFECLKCEYKCSNNSDLQKHIATCTGEMNCSSGEYRVMQVLESMRIDYQYNTSHEVKSTKLLQWDFMIDYKNTKIFIEYNGRQHYRPVQFGGTSMEKATENFRKQQIRDQIKTDYCTENDYPLLWISHKDNVEDSVRKFIVDNTNWDGDMIDGTNWGE